MILHTNSNAAYLVAKNTCSRAGGYHYCGNKVGIKFNRPIHVLAKIIKNVMASAMEADIAALYINAQRIMDFQTDLIDMGHPLPPTVLCTDSKTACGIITGTMKQKRSKAIDMRFNWFKDCVCEQKQLQIK